MNRNPYAPPAANWQEDTVKIKRPVILTWPKYFVILGTGILFGLEIAIGVLIYLHHCGLVPELEKFSGRHL